MPKPQRTSQEFSYAVAGDGFPLVLVPDTRGSIADWSRAMPLLGELCRVLAYEYGTPPPAQPLVALQDFLDSMACPRAYLAGYAAGGQTALHYARWAPERFEALLLIGLEHLEQPTTLRHSGPPASRAPLPLSELDVPTCVFVGETMPRQQACADQLIRQLPRCARMLLPGTDDALHRDQPLRLGHAMLEFLIQCERRRNMVRGASFLL